MQAGDIRLGQVFANDQQNVIPHFQRPYVWTEESNWQPLWVDIRQAAEEVEQESLTGYYPSQHRTYFLGAVVLQTSRKPPKRVALLNVVDGQQRLTTLQILFAAARTVAHELGYSSTAGKFATLIENRPEVVHEDHPNDRYKVWPLPQDRKEFLWAVSPPEGCGPPPDPDHRIVKARAWFETTVRDWIQEAEDPEARLLHLHETLTSRMQLVQISLEQSDDPQVIFEVLNHRGVPLDAADLVKNLLFQQLVHRGMASKADTLLMEAWLPLDKKPWREEISRGRVRRKRIDLLLSYWLTIETIEEVPVEHLFSDFKKWLLGDQHDVTEVIRSIRHYADRMEELRHLPLSDPIGQVLDRMEAAQATTPWPVLLYLWANDAVPMEQKRLAAAAIDSYLVRRSVCRWTTKDYNRLFLQVLAAAKTAEPHHAGEAVVDSLLSQKADSRRWPSDEEFSQALQVPNLFHVITRARLKSMLLGIEHSLHTGKTEPTELLSYVDGRVNIEHILPQKWETHWPLGAAPGDEDYDSILERRQGAIHSLGNLTITTSKLNPSMSNKAWEAKRKELQKHSLLRITTASVLSAPDPTTAMSDETWAAEWNEERIDRRTDWLRDQALRVWPKPA